MNPGKQPMPSQSKPSAKPDPAGLTFAQLLYYILVGQGGRTA
jgi:hypothetical protein